MLMDTDENYDKEKVAALSMLANALFYLNDTYRKIIDDDVIYMKRLCIIFNAVTNCFSDKLNEDDINRVINTAINDFKLEGVKILRMMTKREQKND